MNNKILATLLVATLGTSMAFSAPSAWADENQSSLSTRFDNGTKQYATGPWMFKLTPPIGLSAAGNPASGSRHSGAAGNQPGETEAAASYNLYPGDATAPEIDVTGKVKVNIADTHNTFALNQNDYAAQMDVYQSLDKFTAKGSLGSRFMGSQTGLTLNPLLYGSFGGVYKLTEQTSTGIDMSLSQDPSATGTTLQEFSAFVNYKLDKNFKARGYMLRGISNGTPNNTVGGQVYYGF